MCLCFFVFVLVFLLWCLGKCVYVFFLNVYMFSCLDCEFMYFCSRLYGYVYVHAYLYAECVLF